MKKILLALLLSPIFCTAQKKVDTLLYPTIPRDSITNNYQYSYVGTVPGVKKDILYSRAYQWVALTFVATNEVIQMGDKESGKIVAKGYHKAFYVYRFLGKTVIDYYIRCVLSITVKDDKYKVVISGFDIEQPALEKGKESKLKFENDLSKSMAIVYAYNHGKSFKYDDDFTTRKNVATEQQQFLQNVDDMAQNYLKGLKAIMVKDEF